MPDTAPGVAALQRRRAVQDAAVAARSSSTLAKAVASVPKPVTKERVGRKLLRVAAATPAQRFLSSFFAPAGRTAFPEDGVSVIESWPQWLAPPGQSEQPVEPLRYPGAPEPEGVPVRFSPGVAPEVVVGATRALLKRRKGVPGEPVTPAAVALPRQDLGHTSVGVPGSLLKRRRAAVRKGTALRRRSWRSRRLLVRAKLKRSMRFAKRFWAAWHADVLRALASEIGVGVSESRPDSADASSVGGAACLLAARAVPTEAEAREHANGLLLSFGNVRSPVGHAGLLRPKDVGSGGWCFFDAFFDQLGSVVVPSSRYLAVLALEAMADRHEEFAAAVVGVDFAGTELPEVAAARAALRQIPAYRALGLVELLTPFECSSLDKFEGVLVGDLLDERRYADGSDMHVLLTLADLLVLVLESNDVISGAAAGRSRVYPSGERCGQEVQEGLEGGLLDMVFVRYELGSFQHYVSVEFADGQSWHVSAAKRLALEDAYLASAACAAVRSVDYDVARMLLLTKLRSGADLLDGTVLF